jgi:hypothetical protein
VRNLGYTTADATSNPTGACRRLTYLGSGEALVVEAISKATAFESRR